MDEERRSGKDRRAGGDRRTGISGELYRLKILIRAAGALQNEPLVPGAFEHTLRCLWCGETTLPGGPARKHSSDCPWPALAMEAAR